MLEELVPRTAPGNAGLDPAYPSGVPYAADPGSVATSHGKALQARMPSDVGELARLRAEKTLWGKRSSSPSCIIASSLGRAMHVRTVLGEGLG